MEILILILKSTLWQRRGNENMEKRPSHSQNCTLRASTLLADNVRRRGKRNSKFKRCHCRVFFPVILLSFSVKSLLAGEQRQVFKDENCAGVFIKFQKCKWTFKGSILAEKRDRGSVKLVLLWPRPLQSLSWVEHDSMTPCSLPFSVQSKLIFDLLILSRCYQRFAIKTGFRENWRQNLWRHWNKHCYLFQRGNTALLKINPLIQALTLSCSTTNWSLWQCRTIQAIFRVFHANKTPAPKRFEKPPSLGSHIFMRLQLTDSHDVSHIY